MINKLILQALKEVIEPEKFEELMKLLNIDSFGNSLQNTIMNASVEARKYLGLGGIVYDNVYTATCYAPDGSLKWMDTAHNLVVDTGLVETLEVTIRNQTATATWYLGLTDGTPTVVATDTMASHAGWTEVVAYSEGTRETLAWDTTANLSPSGASISTSSPSPSFSINGTATVGGAFIADNSTKSGGTGTLYGAAAFTGGDKSVSSGDTLNVSVTITASSS